MNEKWGSAVKKGLLRSVVFLLLLTGCARMPELLTPVPPGRSGVQAEEPPVERPEELLEELPEEIPEEEVPPPPAAEDLVVITDHIPTIFVELKYATEDNFTGQVIYDFMEARLRYCTVEKLAAVQEVLLSLGYSLKIWDAYRPPSAQFALWAVCPDPKYVSDPTKGFSGHSRGNTVDVTLVRADGSGVPMPTGFDDFSALADRDYSDVDGEARAMALLLEEAMEAGGFRGYAGEWWHFTDTTDYEPITE